VESDDLNAPLGQNKPKSRLPKLPVPGPQLLAAVLALGGVVVAGWAMVATDPLGGEPMAVVSTKLDPAADSEAAGTGRPRVDAVGGAVARIPDTAKAGEGGRTVTIIDGSSGKRQEVVIPGTSAPDSTDKAVAKAIEGKGPDGKPAAAAPARPEIKSDIDPATLGEKGRYGVIPKIGANGAKPLTVFAQARNLPPALKDRPRIAIVLTGMGISASGTADAFTLPASATFALAPYAVDVARLAERARDEGHEILLQVPMEPFDYPDNDPGPQTLLTSLTPEQNIDRLHWLMSRMQGYVGAVSFMGARFLTAEPALGPVLGETAKRGLMFVDGGASQRSVAGQVAATRNMAFAKADIVIDTVPTPVEIERALARLEIVARESGAAVGIATAQPGTITRIAEWMAKVESRGFVLVPISMIAGKTKSS